MAGSSIFACKKIPSLTGDSLPSGFNDGMKLVCPSQFASIHTKRNSASLQLAFSTQFYYPALYYSFFSHLQDWAASSSR
jgi:hypothetical protein